MQDPDRDADILARLDLIHARLDKVDQIDERLQRVEDAIGPVARLTKVTELAYWKGASAAARDARTHLTEVVRDVLGGFRPVRDASSDQHDAAKEGEPPTANSASLEQRQRRKRAQIAGCAAVAAMLAVSLTYAAWTPAPAGGTSSAPLPLPTSPQAAPQAPAPSITTQAPPPGAGRKDVPQVSAPAGGPLGQPDSPAAPTADDAPTQQHQPALVLGPSASPTVSSSSGCSGLGVRVRRIELCRHRP